MGFDLVKNDFAEQAEAGFEFEIEHPETRERYGAFITVRGDESKKVKAYLRRLIQTSLQEEQVAKRKGREEIKSVEELEDMAVEGAIVRVMGWRGFEQDGEELEFNEENLRKVLKQYAFIRTAIFEESGKLSNFS